jgi:(p)ppGpp synthase/HD superfamily hydrolase
VIGSEGVPFEIQIRTWAMHETAEYGIAAHWKYKEGKGVKVVDEEKFAWVRRQLESQQDSDAQDFFQALKIDMFADAVFVYTPKGDVVSLPAGSTPVDFAYSIHSAIGNSMMGAIVNKRMVPYTHILQNGDIIEVLTSKSAKGPSRDWLNIVKSPEARNKIRQWFKKEKREENIMHGKLALESELRHANIRLADVLSEDMLPKVLARLSFATLDDMYAAIGYGGVSAYKAVNKIRDEVRPAPKPKKEPVEKEKTAAAKKQDDRIKPMQSVTVEGLDNCLVKFARCCTPVPGDPIVGFITRGFGVSVHRKDCSNYIRPELKAERERSAAAHGDAGEAGQKSATGGEAAGHGGKNAHKADAGEAGQVYRSAMRDMRDPATQGDASAGKGTQGEGGQGSQNGANGGAAGGGNGARGNSEAGRWVRVSWANTEDKVFPTTIHVISRDRNGLIVDVATALNALRLRMSSFNARDVGDGTASITIIIDVKNRDELVAAMAKIMTVSSVTDVRRSDR